MWCSSNCLSKLEHSVRCGLKILVQWTNVSLVSFLKADYCIILCSTCHLASLVDQYRNLTLINWPDDENIPVQRHEVLVLHSEQFKVHTIVAFSRYT